MTTAKATDQQPRTRTADPRAQAAAASAAQLAADRLVCVAERHANETPPIASAAMALAQEEIQNSIAQAHAMHNGQPDDTTRVILAQAEQNLATAQKRLDTALTGTDRDVMALDPYIRLAVEHAAIAGRMTHHHSQVKDRPYPEERTAHASAADQLSIQFQASLGLLRDTQPDQANPAHRAALELATEFARDTASAYQSITALKRQFLPVIVSEDMDENVAAMFQSDVSEFRNLEVPINFHIISSPSPQGTMEHEVVIMYLGQDAIHIAFAGDDYPPDTPAETAFEHYQYMSQWTNYLAAQPSSPELEQTLTAARKATATTYLRFQAGLHAARMDDVLETIEEAISLGIDPQTIRNFITGLCDNQPNLTQGITQASGLDKLANDEQAAAIVAAAEKARVPQGTINALIEFLGHDPARLGQPQTITKQQDLAHLANLMMAARVPGNNAVQALTQAGLSDQAAYRIAEEAGYQVFARTNRPSCPRPIPSDTSAARRGGQHDRQRRTTGENLQHRKSGTPQIPVP